MTRTSPDGTKSYGPPQTVAVRRTTDPARGTIEELVVHPGRELPLTTLVRSPGTTRFAASDAAASYTGTLTFTGKEWAWDSWSYDIAMADGSGTLRGEGTLSPHGLETKKTFFGTDGAPKVRIVEKLERVDERSFEETRRALTQATRPDHGAR